MNAFNADLHSGRASLTRVEVVETRDDEGLQRVTVKGLDGEVIKHAHRLQMFGDSSHAPKGAHGLALSVGGRRDQALLLGLEHPDHRPKDQPEGERILYNAHGDKIFMYKERIKVVTKTVEIVAETVVTITTPRAVIDCPDIRLGSPGASARVLLETGPATRIRGV